MVSLIGVSVRTVCRADFADLNRAMGMFQEEDGHHGKVDALVALIRRHCQPSDRHRRGSEIVAEAAGQTYTLNELRDLWRVTYASREIAGEYLEDDAARLREGIGDVAAAWLGKVRARRALESQIAALGTYDRARLRLLPAYAQALEGEIEASDRLSEVLLPSPEAYAAALELAELGARVDVAGCHAPGALALA